MSAENERDRQILEAFLPVEAKDDVWRVAWQIMPKVAAQNCIYGWALGKIREMFRDAGVSDDARARFYTARNRRRENSVWNWIADGVEKILAGDYASWAEFRLALGRRLGQDLEEFQQKNRRHHYE